MAAGQERDAPPHREGHLLLLSRLWLLVGVFSLLLSGVLSFVVTGAKMPFVKSLIGDLEVIRWSLVVHVNLAMLVWFTAIPLGLSHSVLEGGKPRRQQTEALVSFLGLLIAVVGIVLMVTALPGPEVTAILSNYIPTLTHPRHSWGITLYMIGAFVSYLTPTLLLTSEITSPQAPKELLAARFGLWVGAAFFVLSFITFGLSFHVLPPMSTMDVKTYYELGMWGGGHLLQHSSSVFLVVAWVYLLNGHLGDLNLWSRQALFPVFAFLSLPVFAVPLLLAHSPSSNEYREGFAALMRWGIAPALIYFMARTLHKVGIRRLYCPSDARSIAVLGSFFLVTLGFVYGALIGGYDLRVPGHYHATIGAVTIAFMATSHQLLFMRQGKLMSWAARVYTPGQILFSTGMFVAGSFGVSRKTYGTEYVLANAGQYVGFGILAVGGTVALLGGVLFGTSIVRNLRWAFPRDGRSE